MIAPRDLNPEKSNYDMRTNTSPVFYKCGILKFVDLIAYKTLIDMFKVKE